jgi:hypothetical protein
VNINPVLYRNIKDNNMRELHVKEVEAVNGGNPWAFMLLGYVDGQIIDSAWDYHWSSGRRSNGGQMSRYK